jgi:plastocyanin
MFSKALIATALAAATASAATVNVDVSNSGGSFTFSPDSVTAQSGDTVTFTFKATGHTVVQGDFNNACQPAASNPFYSGMQTPPTVFSVNVSSTDPIWFYCSADHHCQSGMVGVINPP